MSMMPRRPFLGLLILLLASLPTVAMGEGMQTGILTGKVTDGEGTPLPGVDILLHGPRGESRGSSGEGGSFRFSGLPVATYRIEADLLGLTAEREAQVFIDTITAVELRLREPTEAVAAEEAEPAIQVLAVAPLLDGFETRLGTSVTRELLEELPVERFYQSVALLLPGVAAGEDGNPNVSGALRESNSYLVDGVDTSDATTGLFGLNLGYESVAEVRVTTAAASVDLGQVSGAVIDVVTRSGSNDFRGSARWVLASPDLESDHQDPAPALQAEIQAANSPEDTAESELAATLGGPLQTDRFWFFGAFASEEGALPRPTRTTELWNEDTDLESSSVKLDWQSARRHSLVAQHFTDSATFTAFGLFDAGPGENRVGQRPNPLGDTFGDRIPGEIFALQELSQEGELDQLRWQGIFGGDFTLSATLANQDRRLERGARNRSGLSADAPHFSFTEIMAEPLADGSELITEVSSLYNGVLEEGFEERQQEQANLAAELFLSHGKSEHELSFGLDLRRSESLTALGVPGQDGFDPVTGRAVVGQLYFDEDLSDACFFDGVCQLGFDRENGTFLPSALLNFWARPARGSRLETTALHLQDSVSRGRWLLSLGLRFSSVRGEDDQGQALVEDDALAPRLSFKFDPKGDGKALLSASFARFHEPFRQSFLDDFLLGTFYSGYTEYEWGELFGLDCTGQDPTDPAAPCWQLFEIVPFGPVQLASPNLNLQRAVVDEWVFSFERQLSANTAFRLSWTQREWQELWDDRLEFLEDDLIFSLENLPEARRRYRGLHLLVQKRFAQRWRLLGSYSWSEAEGNLFQQTGLSTFADFAAESDVNLQGRFGPAPYDRTYQLKTFASVRLPLGWADLAIGTALSISDGTPYQRERGEDLGTRFLTPRGSLELEDVFQWDLSLAMDVPLAGGMDLWLKLEAFNLTDEQERLGVETNVDFDFGDPRSLADLQQPRRFRLTVGLDF